MCTVYTHTKIKKLNLNIFDAFVSLFLWTDLKIFETKHKYSVPLSERVPITPHLASDESLSFQKTLEEPFPFPTLSSVHAATG